MELKINKYFCVQTKLEKDTCDEVPNAFWESRNTSRIILKTGFK